MEKAQNTDNTKAKWTVMAYMAGDNNLDGAALRDIDEMAKVGSTKDVNCLVQLDRIEDQLTRRFRITKIIRDSALLIGVLHQGGSKAAKKNENFSTLVS